ncbi:MFS transporter [Gracilibacillus caseinilyticus]|uniref:MFS transporter n=1 Tax=Gracilibacillus caseinilyticus TaxID=2932256 RepID=A0ABY4F046_9BACI|nr:MFS transporter [Gracilibacillus caseinilyticus]UOQ50035.1 MFS transporter [Gracilibacillus caseinilyticus]
MTQAIGNKEKRLSSHAVQILINHALFQFGGSLSIIFVNLYLWRLTNSLWVNGMYNLLAIFSQAATTFLIGKVSKKKGRTIIYRYGILMTAVFYLMIVIVQEAIVDYFYIFALLRGVAQGLYWVAYFTIVHEVSSDQNRHRYLGWNQIVMGSTKLLAPVISGYIISLYTGLTGYLIVFSMAFFMFFIATVGSFRIKKESIRHRTYYMKYLRQIIDRQKLFRNALIGWFIIGFPQGILMYVPPILIYSIFEKESVVGYLNAAFLAVSIVASYIISRFANIEHTTGYLWVAAIGLFISGTFLAWEIAIWSVILFMVTKNMFNPLQANAYAAYYFQWINRLPLGAEFRVESVVLRETIINIGRGLGIITFMIFSNEIDTNTVAYVIIAAMAIQVLLPLLTKVKEEG